jgi:hypothetical protein
VNLIYAAPANNDEINAEVCFMERVKVGIIGSGKRSCKVTARKAGSKLTEIHT